MKSAKSFPGCIITTLLGLSGEKQGENLRAKD
jgi:hypothetical protein